MNTEVRWGYWMRAPLPAEERKFSTVAIVADPLLFKVFLIRLSTYLDTYKFHH